MTAAHFTHIAGRLIPEDENARAFVAGLKTGALVKADVSKPRNADHLRKYWKLCTTLADAFGQNLTAEGVSDVLKLKTGHTRKIKTRQGIIETPASISFAAMDQTQFHQFYERCLMVIREVWLPHLKNAAEVEKMIAPKAAA